MTERERIARVIEPSLWDFPFRGTGNLKGLRLCALKKADRLISAGLTLRDASVAVPVYGGK